MYPANKFEARDQLKDHYFHIQRQKNNIQDKFSIENMDSYKPESLSIGQQISPPNGIYTQQQMHKIKKTQIKKF